MPGNRLPRPDRTGFTRRVVADCEHKIHHRRARDSELLPTLGAEADRRIIGVRQHLERKRIDGAFGMTAGREGPETAATILFQNAFRQAAACASSAFGAPHVSDDVAGVQEGAATAVRIGPRSTLSP